MRKTFGSHQELAHVWAQNNQSEGKASRMFFREGKLYSYGQHFCIARILPSGVVVFGNHTYSSSTSGHQYKARAAVSHRKKVYCQDPDRSAWANRDYTEDQIKRLLEEANTDRKVLPATRVKVKLRALGVAEEFNEYLAALPEKEVGAAKPFDLKALEVSEAELQIVRQYDAEVEERREAKWARDRVKRQAETARWAEQEKTKVQDWRNHAPNVASLYNIPTMLRLSKDGESVETSKGANIPVSHAKRLWPLIQNCKLVGEGLRREMRLGHYTLDEIKPTGDIVVGCHNIPYAEIEMIAKALGLLEEVSDGQG